uniref:Uncharacterized protein n=1 Tax=Rhizophora mucronata TaxID=61149 RepID=A0A2P2P9W5_RHIMU
MYIQTTLKSKLQFVLHYLFTENICISNG